MSPSVALALALTFGSPPADTVWVSTDRPAAAPVYVTRIETTYRSPSGHTHSPGCGHVFDHLSTAGHSCPALVVRNGRVETCGAVQFYQDQSPRMVTITRAVKVQVNR